MKKFYIIYFLLIAFIIFPASDKSKKLQKKFESIEDFIVQFDLSSNGSPSLSGYLFYKKENNFRIETQGLLIINNGIDVWNYNEKKNKVIITENNPSSNPLFSIHKIIYEYPSKCKVEEEGNRLILTPVEALAFQRAEIELTEDFLISGVKITDNLNNQISVEFSNYKLNLNQPDSRFTFVSPEGSEVIDLR